MKSKFRDGCDEVHRFPTKKLSPRLPAHNCLCNLAYDEKAPIKISDCTVYLSHGFVKCELFALDCPNKSDGCRVMYNGEEHGLWVCSARVAISIAILTQCIEQVTSIVFATNRVVQMRRQHGSIAGFHQCQALQYSNHTDSAAFCSYWQFRQAFFSFLPFVKPNFPGDPAICPRCKSTPDVVFCDGMCRFHSFW